MKTNQRAAVSAAATAICILASPSNAQNTTIPLLPVGDLSAFPTIVQTGTKPTLNWNILFPNSILSTTSGGGGGGGGGTTFGSSLVTISPPGTLIPNGNLYVTVQPVGTTVTACDPSQGFTSPPAEARMSLAGAPYVQLFYGTQADVRPSSVLYNKKLSANQKLDFGGRFVRNGAWTPFYTTRSLNMQVIAMANGDTPPTSTSLYQSSLLANFLKPYLDASGKIKVGPMSVLIMMELGQTDRLQPCFDYQDMVLLVTFSTKQNNGHGNNIDGVDSSNPGKGGGGPNGAVDPSGGVDDER